MNRACRYYNTASGCARGDDCKFDHTPLSTVPQIVHAPTPPVNLPTQGPPTANASDAMSEWSDRKTDWTLAYEQSVVDGLGSAVLFSTPNKNIKSKSGPKQVTEVDYAGLMALDTTLVQLFEGYGFVKKDLKLKAGTHVFFEMTTSSGDLITQCRESHGKTRHHTYIEHKLRKYLQIFTDQTNVLPIGPKALVIVFNGSDSTRVQTHLSEVMNRVQFVALTRGGDVGLVYLNANFALKFGMKEIIAKKDAEAQALIAKKDAEAQALIAKKDAEIAKKDAESQALRAQLAAAQAALKEQP